MLDGLPGVEINNIPVKQVATANIGDRHLEQLAKSWIVGDKVMGRQKDVRAVLEKKVVGRIGRKGKHLVDKLFELIEGVRVVQRVHKNAGGFEEIVAYKRPPDLQAIIYALDRVLGKPKQLNIQANFSLSKLLIGNGESNDGSTRPNNNKTISEQSDLLYPEDVGLESAADQG